MTLGELKELLLGFDNSLEDPFLEIRVLLSYLGMSEIEQITERSKVLAPDFVDNAVLLFKKRINGTPMAYITHSKEFYGHSFYVDERVLIPRPDTEILVERAIEEYRSHNYRGKILDICTGSGAVAVSIAYALNKDVSFSDLSPEALEIARKNYITITGKKGDGKLGSLFEPWKGEKFSLITANPPYLTQSWYMETERDVKSEPVMALVSDSCDGMDIIREIVSNAREYLEEKGMLLIECDYRQTEPLSALLKESGFSNVKTAKDLGGRERIVYGEYTHSSD